MPTTGREDGARPAPGPAALGVAAVARRLGVAPATLRSWHRRYGIGPSAHTSGGNRRYRPEDVERLRLMQRALVRGVPAADAAHQALHSAGVPASDTGGSAAPAAASRQRSRPGGRGLRLGGADAAAQGLGRAVLSLDTAAVRSVLADAITARGVVATWDEVARPVLVAVAERWAGTGGGVETEHLLTQCLIIELGAVAGAAPPAAPRNVLLACAPDELHSLPLHATAAALAETGIPGRLLGAALPEVALRAAVRRTAPAAVLLWAHSDGPARALGDLLADLPRRRLRCRWFVGGPGWAATPLPAEVTPLTSLSTAVETVRGVVAGSPR